MSTRDSDEESNLTYYSAVLQAPRDETEYCLSCSEKEESRLCLKCRDSYICVKCAPNLICKNCIIKCLICLETRYKGDFLTDVCEKCEEKISDLNGDIIDEEGLPHRNLVELINADLRGKITTDEVIQEEIYEYLTNQGIIVEDASLIN